MSESTNYTIERNEKLNIDRRERFIPGVVYGRIMNSKSLGFKKRKFKRMLQGSTKYTKFNVKS